MSFEVILNYIKKNSFYQNRFKMNIHTRKNSANFAQLFVRCRRTYVLEIVLCLCESTIYINLTYYC